MDSTNFPNVFKMLKTVAEEKGETSFVDYLKQHMKVQKYFPMLQMKKVFKSKSLILIHNTYKRNDVSHFKDLYEEARSVIIDTDKPVGENIVVSLADKIPESMTIDEYRLKAKDTDVIQKAHEGTMIYVYNHDNAWYFGTSTIPDIDYSRYFHPTKTHGDMFDEAIAKYFEEGSNAREKFVEHLSPNKTYGFLLVHYQNGNLMDYTQEFDENYAVLFHIFSRDKETKGKSVDYTDKLGDLPVKYANDDYTVDECARFIEMDSLLYGYIIRTEEGEIYKVCHQEVFDKENKNRGNSNVWHNMIDVYMKGVPHYKVVDYINEFVKDKDALTMTDEQGRTYEPTYIIHEVIRNICDTLYRLYRTTTYYNKYTGRYTIMHEVDSTLAPIMRFHLAQLRIIQITSHKEAPITPRNVRDYICHNQTMKNIRLLVSHFTKMFRSQEQTKNYKSTMCFYFLNTLLIN